jgi:hypothetical protein
MGFVQMVDMNISWFNKQIRNIALLYGIH